MTSSFPSCCGEYLALGEIALYRQARGAVAAVVGAAGREVGRTPLAHSCSSAGTDAT